MKYFIIALIFLFSCESQSKNDEKMKMVVNNYFSNIKDNDIEKIPSLFWEQGIFSGAIASDAFFINKHYTELRIDSLLKQMIIKDTTSIIPSQKQKYIQFTIKKSEDNLPVIITFIFDKMNGFDKISNPNVLQNQMYWNKSLDSLRKKGIFPRTRY
ncbi:MAG: hypothetical protein DI529_07615 [Chryseobacterium sp.]|nr:MAG: hypothetical protein DI529_07615 [Chryseobacterium sp.]